MVSPSKLQAVEALQQELQRYSMIGILDMHKLPGRQLFEIRNKLRSSAKIRMVKKGMMIRALEGRGLSALASHIQGEPALLLSNENPFRIAQMIMSSKSQAAAKAGDTAPKDILIPAGPTPLAPGPAIGELQKIKLKVGVEGDKIAVKQDAVVAKAGEAISKEVASVLGKLGITPMEIGLTLRAAWESGTIFLQDVLFVPRETYAAQVREAAANAFALTLHLGFPTSQNIGFLVGKAWREAKALARESGIPSPETIGDLLAKAEAQAHALEGKVKQPEASRITSGKAPAAGAGSRMA